MAKLDQYGSAHECFARLLFEIDPRELIRIVHAAAGLNMPEIARISVSDPRVEVPGLFSRAKRNTIDAIFVTYDANDRATSVWVLEIQLSEDYTKIRRWGLYPLAFAVQVGADGKQILLVPEPSLRRKIRRQIRAVVPRPILILPRHIERIADYDEARRRPYLTIFGALFHVWPPARVEERIAAFRAAWIAVQTFTDETYLRYAKLVMSITPHSIVERGIKQLRESGDLVEEFYELVSETERQGHSFVRGHLEGLEQGREEGLEQGLEEGLEQGLEQGICRTLRRSIVDVVELRGLRLTRAQRRRIAACESVETLERWYAAAKSANTAAQVFA